MKRALIVATALTVALPCLAGDLERGVKSRWLGAWVTMEVEAYSDCNGPYTDNTVNGQLVRSRGHRRFQPGEIAKIEKLDTGRSRVAVALGLTEPVLVAWQDGPFTLYREAECRVELEIELPRDLVRKKDVDAVDTVLAALLARHPSVEEARDSEAWNGRVREPYPEDYETTLAEHAIWKATQTNAAVQARLEAAREETARLADRLSSDPAYLSGFARGVEDARRVDLGDCSGLMSFRLTSAPSGSGRPPLTTEAARSDQGYQDGRVLVLGLQMLQRLPACFVPVPEPAPVTTSRR